jgi:hypothetical protein
MPDDRLTRRGRGETIGATTKAPRTDGGTSFHAGDDQVRRLHHRVCHGAVKSASNPTASAREAFRRPCQPGAPGGKVGSPAGRTRAEAGWNTRNGAASSGKPENKATRIRSAVQDRGPNAEFTVAIHTHPLPTGAERPGRRRDKPWPWSAIVGPMLTGHRPDDRVFRDPPGGQVFGQGRGSGVSGWTVSGVAVSW